MTIIDIVGTTNLDERAAVAELVAIVGQGGVYSADLLDRLPTGRVDVHVQADVSGNLAVIVIEDGVFRLQPLDTARPGRIQ
jgi:hypothetical protein